MSLHSQYNALICCDMPTQDSIKSQPVTYKGKQCLAIVHRITCEQCGLYACGQDFTALSAANLASQQFIKQKELGMNNTRGTSVEYDADMTNHAHGEAVEKIINKLKKLQEKGKLDSFMIVTAKKTEAEIEISLPKESLIEVIAGILSNIAINKIKDLEAPEKVIESAGSITPIFMAKQLTKLINDFPANIFDVLESNPDCDCSVCKLKNALKQRAH